MAMWRHIVIFTSEKREGGENAGGNYLSGEGCTCYLENDILSIW